MKPSTRSKIVTAAFGIALCLFMLLPDALEGAPFLPSLAAIAIGFAVLIGLGNIANRQEEER